MEELSDQELQVLVEALRREGKLPPEDDKSAQLYAHVFDELEIEPAVDLSLSFSGNIIRQIQRQQATRYQIKAYLLFGFTMVVLFGIAFAFQAIRSADDSTATWHALSHIKWPVLFLVVLTTLIQWADHRFVKSQQLHKHT